MAESKNSRAVGYSRDKIAFRRVIISCCRIFCDGPHGYSDAGRIGKAEVPLGRHRLGSDDLDFSRPRSEEHTSELQSLMRISYAVFCLKKKKKYTQSPHTTHTLICTSINNTTWYRPIEY